MGAEDAVHVLDDAVAGSDVIGTARGARRRDPAPRTPRSTVDLVVTGMAALDGLTSMLPTALAELLDLPALHARRRADGRRVHGARASQPRPRVRGARGAPCRRWCRVTDQANEPRYPNFKGIMAARKKPITP